MDQNSNSKTLSNGNTKLNNVDNRCICGQLYDQNFPYRDFPPPAPPNGRTDLWELQFCRWWGWNWVRRRDSPALCKKHSAKTSDTRSSTNVKSKKKGSFFKCGRNKPPSKTGSPSVIQDQPSSASPHRVQSRKLTNCSAERAPPIPPRPVLPGQQIKDICRCLMGKKQTPTPVAKLFNTPSHSSVALQRISYERMEQIVDTSPQRGTCTKETCRRKTRCQKRQENQCKAQSWTKPSDHASPKPSVSETGETLPQTLSAQKGYSSTEESIEYLSVRLQHIRSDICCPCRRHKSPPTKEASVVPEQPVREHLEVQTSLHTRIDSKETQTSPEAPSKSCMPPLQDNVQYEKVIKLKGKKHKTLCICVCCCGINGNCENNLKQPPCIKDGVPCMDTKKGILSDLILDKDPTIATYPVSIPLPSTKMLSKFGTPSKSYPWMHRVTSDATTTTLNNSNNSFESPFSGKTYDLKSHCITNFPNVALPELIDISEDLSYLKTVEDLSRSESESRILLDAVCDAILKDNEEKDKWIEQLEIGSEVKGALGRDYKEFGLLCDLKGRQNDAYTEYSRQLLTSMEDRGVQQSNLGVSQIDSVINSIINDPKESEEEFFKFKGTTNPAFTKTGLLPFKNSSVYRKPVKRLMDGSKSENSNKKSRKDSFDNRSTTGATSERIGNIFSKIEDIVKQSKVKSAEIQKGLSLLPQNSLHPMYKCQEMLDNNAGLGGSSKRTYPISSDKINDIFSDQKKYYEVFGNRSYQCPLTSETIVEEQLDIHLGQKNQNFSSKCANGRQKPGKLSMQSFILCDGRLAEEKAAASGSGIKSEKKIIKKKKSPSKGSLIPVRKPSKIEDKKSGKNNLANINKK